MLPVNTKLRQHARTLRKNATKEENKLWYQFLRGYPIQFRRQFVIGSYITDFYSHKAKLIIEIDGSQHYSNGGEQYDKIRTEYFSKLGLAVIRFSNADLNEHFDSVCEYIDQCVNDVLSSPDASRHPPQRGG